MYLRVQNVLFWLGFIYKYKMYFQDNVPLGQFGNCVVYRLTKRIKLEL